MIARQETVSDPTDIWARIAAPIPANIVQWRQQGKAKARDSKYFAPFVAYIDAQFVRARLDAVVAGEWDLTLEHLPMILADANGEASDEPVSFKARLQILGVIREDVGCGKDYKTASTDAFKRAAVRFGVAHELYTDYEIVWVQVDSDSKFAKPLEDPAQVWARKNGRPALASGAGEARSQRPATTEPSATPPVSAPAAAPAASGDEASCPKCGGKMWDNRIGKKNPKSPDFKCRTRTCDGVIWPPRARRSEPEPGEIPTSYDDAPPYDDADLF